ncbi:MULTISPECIES: SMI1/KNR4 family protein [unclassified Streptomyces]|uniref:SMI1/KNR4 family protein n=1 Tax=unclassified Streptomyces TaxID=2593676 RepID=UPI0033F5B322
MGDPVFSHRWRRRPGAQTPVPEAAPTLRVDEDAWAAMDPEARVEAVVAMLSDGTTASPTSLRGLSDQAIQEVTLDQDAPLGAAYRLFLELIGGGAGRFLQGSDAFHPDVIGLREAAVELLTENDVSFSLSHSDRVIFMHQGYCFDFLRGAEPDPEVWSYTEGDPSSAGPSRTASSFTEWLRAHAEEQTEAWARLVPWYEAEKRKKPRDRRIYFTKRLPDGTHVDEL